VEAIRAQGYGLGGVITPVGVGTEIGDEKQHISIKGRDYLIQEPLGGDIAIIKAKNAERFGNCIYHGTARNFNPYIAMAAKKTILLAEKVVEIGELDKEKIHTPGVFIDFIIEGEETR